MNLIMGFNHLVMQLPQNWLKFVRNCSFAYPDHFGTKLFHVFEYKRWRVTLLSSLFLPFQRITFGHSLSPLHSHDVLCLSDSYFVFREKMLSTMPFFLSFSLSYICVCLIQCVVLVFRFSFLFHIHSSISALSLSLLQTGLR